MINLPYNAVMVDLETMGTENNASIISIGAVRFWLNVKQDSFTEDQCFYMNVDLTDCIRNGLTVTGDTIMWWMSQSEEARKAFTTGEPLRLALENFKMFVPEKAYVFGNGATFDNIILRSAFKAVGLDYPVSYKYDACYRTLCKLSDSPFPKIDGTKHNALDDAKAQTLHLMQILEEHPWRKK